MADIHIKTTDGFVNYPNAQGCSITEQGVLRVKVGDLETDETDTIYFSPSYWQQYVKDPHDKDPFNTSF